MFDAKAAHSIALQVAREPVEEQIRIAVNQGKFLVYFNELHYEVFVYLSELGYTVKPGLSSGYVVSWYKS